MNMYNLKENECGKVISIDNNKSSKLRLAEMGIMPGVDIRMIKKAPFGGPVNIKINNYYISLRKEDAVLIEIRDLN